MLLMLSVEYVSRTLGAAIRKKAYGAKDNRFRAGRH